MGQFVENPLYFAADCVRHDGQCTVERENILFLDDGKELAAVDHLQRKCGSVVIIPEVSQQGQAWLYHTSCERMTDVVGQIFRDCLEAPVGLPQYPSEMSVGELYRRHVTLSYGECRARVERFDFQRASRA
jgi:hypothetical protein